MSIKFLLSLQFHCVFWLRLPAASQYIEASKVFELLEGMFPNMSSSTRAVVYRGNARWVQWWKEGSEVGVKVEWVLRHWRWTGDKDLAHFFGDKNSEGRPVSVTRVEVALILVERVYLDSVYCHSLH